MNPNDAKQSPPNGSTPAPAFDRARVITRSMRCLTFGCIALIPLGGLPSASIAFRLRRQIIVETGERWSLLPIWIIWILGLAPAGFLSMAREMPAAFACLAIMTVAQGWLLWRGYRRNPPGQWNPGRSLVYWGIALASTGVCFSLHLIALLLNHISRAMH